MTDRVPSGSFLTEEQSHSLRILLNMIVPPNKGKGLPGAGELDFVGYVREFAPDQIEAVQNELDLLEQTSQSQYQRRFADLKQIEQDSLVGRMRKRDVEFALHIIVQAMGCYYQDDKVVIALGMEARPPFPKGNDVVSGDLSLLDPVREKKQIYKDV